MENDELHSGDYVAARSAFELTTSAQKGPADPDAH